MDKDSIIAAINNVIKMIGIERLKYGLIIRLPLLLFFIFLIFFVLLIFKKNKVKDVVLNVSLIVSSVILFFCVAEIIFMFIPKSHAVGYTLGARAWFTRYWNPINRFGFRDSEIITDAVYKNKIFVVGDSVVAGHGIKDVKDRFSNILQRKLNQNYRVFNMGVGGYDTLDEIELLKVLPFKPDIIILSYFPNDIQGRSSKGGIQFSGFSPYKSLNPVIRFIVKSSYFINFLFWQFSHGDTTDYTNFLKDSYENEIILKAHLNDLRWFIDYSEKNKVSLYVVIFPFLRDLEVSSVLLQPIREFFSQNNIDYIDVSDLILNVPPNKLIVNKNDEHPSVLVNQLVANELFNKIEK